MILILIPRLIQKQFFLYDLYGEDCFKYLNGDFAIVIYDKSKNNFLYQETVLAINLYITIITKILFTYIFRNQNYKKTTGRCNFLSKSCISRKIYF